MSETLETLSTYIARIESVEGQMQKPIVLSTDVKIPTISDGDIVKETIAWPLYDHNMFYIVTVPANKYIPRHSHNENVFRYVVQGSLTLNGSIQVTQGMWFVVKANIPYEIKTETGYTTLAGYVRLCVTNLADDTHDQQKKR